MRQNTENDKFDTMISAKNGVNTHRPQRRLLEDVKKMAATGIIKASATTQLRQQKPLKNGASKKSGKN